MQRMRVLVSDAAQAYTEEEYAILHGERPPVSINDAGEAIELTSAAFCLTLSLLDGILLLCLFEFLFVWWRPRFSKAIGLLLLLLSLPGDGKPLR